MAFYRPAIIRASRLGSYDVGPYACTLIGDIEAAGGVQYLYILEVIAPGSGMPILYIASEVNTMAKALGGPSHFLGAFPGSGHVNYGASNDWADREKFLAAALEKVAEHFKIRPAPPATGKIEATPTVLRKDFFVLTVKGEVDATSLAEFDHAIQSAVNRGALKLVVDLTGVTLLSEAGKAVLVAASKSGRFVVVHPTGTIGATALHPLDVRPTVEGA